MTKGRRPTPRAERRLRELERVLRVYGPGASDRKLALMSALSRAVLDGPAAIVRLHEALAFLSGFPDDRRVLAATTRLLRGFARRRDLRRFAPRLVNSGIAGTAIEFRFFAGMARWLVERWPERVTIDWASLDHADALEDLLPMLALPAEAPGLDEYDLGLRRWIDLLRGRDTDARFVIRRLAELPMSSELHETIVDGLDVPLRLAPGDGPPSRTLARAPLRVHYQTRPLDHARPDLLSEIARPPLAVRTVSEREAARYIDLAHAAMAARSRDLDAFAHADPKDVRLVEFERGLTFVALGVVPKQRLLLESVYGFLTLRNGVPVGYVLMGALFGSCEVAFNVFETFRDGESGWTYGRAIAMAHALFGADAFMIPPYQLGDGNDEAIESGAWWFYAKLGFRPHDRGARALASREWSRIQRSPGYRSGAATLRRLASHPMFLDLGAPRHDTLGRLPLANVGIAVSRMLARRFGADRSRAESDLERDAARALGVGSIRRWTNAERDAWRRWAPLVPLLLAEGRWNVAERRRLVDVIRAKGARRESEFVRRFDAHPLLRTSLARLAQRTRI
jgi:hypothetical protein